MAEVYIYFFFFRFEVRSRVFQRCQGATGRITRRSEPSTTASLVGLFVCVGVCDEKEK